MTDTTIDALLAEGARRLRSAGLHEPGRQARLLLGKTTGLSVETLIAKGAERVDSVGAGAYFELIERRAAREPLQHLLGEASFYGLTLVCDRRALVPRPDTEALVDLVLDVFPDGPGRIVDLGTGSGCALLAALSRRPAAEGLGLDTSPEALVLASENALRTGLSNRVQFRETDWAAWRGWGEADLIMSNPPYVRTGDIDDLEPEVRDHDPRAALDGGVDGLDAYRDILARAGARMRPGAWLALEIGAGQAEAVDAMMTAAGFVELRRRSDLDGRLPALAGRRGGRSH